MPTLAIVYFSHTGTTHQLAKAIKSGALKHPTMSCVMHRVSGDEIVKGRFINEECLNSIDAADAVCFGSPTYMGGPAAQFKAFADASSERWDSQSWAGKLAAGFTTGTSAGGDQLSTLQYFTVLAAQHGMLWMNLDIPKNHNPARWNTLGTQLGFAGFIQNETLSEADATTASYLGNRLAEYCCK